MWVSKIFYLWVSKIFFQDILFVGVQDILRAAAARRFLRRRLLGIPFVKCPGSVRYPYLAQTVVTRMPLPISDFDAQAVFAVAEGSRV